MACLEGLDRPRQDLVNNPGAGPSNSHNAKQGETNMKKTILRRDGNEWCSLEVTLENGQLSICGSVGDVVSRATAKKMAIESWVSFFEDSPTEILQLGCRTPSGAAKKVVKIDGEFHGLDVHADAEKEVYILTSCGQISEELLRFFPEVAPYMKWHLNDLKASCEHQEALGWGRGKSIALAAGDLTEAQRATLNGKADAACEKARSVEYARRWAELTTDRKAAAAWVKRQTGTCTISDLEILTNRGIGPHHARAAFERRLHAEVDAAIKPVPFEAEIYKDSLCAPCPTCGYEYGTAWLKRELPPEVIAWVEGLDECGGKAAAVARVHDEAMARS